MNAPKDNDQGSTTNPGCGEPEIPADQTSKDRFFADPPAPAPAAKNESGGGPLDQPPSFPLFPAILHSKFEQWLLRKREMVTASECAAALNLDPFMAPGDLYASKLGIHQRAESEAMRWGRRMEGAIASGYHDITGRIVEPEAEFEVIAHPDIPWLGATPDRGIAPTTSTAEMFPAPRPGRGVLELKASSRADLWDTDPPVAYQIQLTIQMACTRREWGSLAAFLSLFRPVVWCDRTFDKELFGLMLPRLEEFHLAVQRREPLRDPNWHSRESIRALFATDDGEDVELDDNALVVANKWKEAKECEAIWRKDREKHEDTLRLIMGSAAVGVLPDGSEITLFTTPASTVREHTRMPFRTLRRRFPKER